MVEGDQVRVRGRPFGPAQLPSVVVCCGLPGSGKSWFSQILEAEKGYVRVSQDDLGSRSACEDLLCSAVKQKKLVVVDRCNPTLESRAVWLSLARYPASATCIHFNADEDTCRIRAQARQTSHANLRTPASIDAAMKHFTKEFQVPDLTAERFRSIVTVPSFSASRSALAEFFGLSSDCVPTEGIEVQPAAAASSFESLFKFPKTRHLVRLGAGSRDDTVMGKQDRLAYMNPPPHCTLTLEEKVDGANIGISVGPDLQLLVQNRGHYVISGSHAQFKALDRWLGAHSFGLFQVLLPENSVPGRYILFGEWLSATHSIRYSKLPDRFLAFDICDRVTEKFFSRKKFHQALEGADIAVVPELTGYSLPLTEERVVQMVSLPSAFYDGRVEGVYLRIDEGEWLTERAKVVRSDFIEGEEFWDKGLMKWNAVSHG